MNGPAIAARGPQVAVAWYTKAAEEPRVRVAFSGDGGESFEAPVDAHHGEPLGRVDVDFLAADPPEVVLSDLTEADGRTFLCARTVRRSGVGPVSLVAELEGTRADGFPRLTAVDGGALLAWTCRKGEETSVAAALLVPEEE